MNGSLREAAVTGEPTRYERPAPTAPTTDSSPHRTLDHRALPTPKSERPLQLPYRTIRDPNEPATNVPTPSHAQLSYRPGAVPPSKPPCLGHAPSLASISRDDAEKYLATIRPALDAIDREDLPARSCVALPPGLDRSALRQLPFRVRTHNCLNAAGLFDGNGLLTARDLLRLPGFGELSLRDLLMVVSEYLNQCIRDAPSEYSQQPPPNTPDVDPSHSPKLPVSHPRGTTPSISLEALLTRLLVAASELQGAGTLADLLSPDVARLASVIGVLDDLQTLSVPLLSKANTNHSASVMHDANQLCDRLTPSQRTVLELRFLAIPRKTLGDVGNLLGVTRERVRQIQAKITALVGQVFRPALSEMATVMKSQ